MPLLFTSVFAQGAAVVAPPPPAAAEFDEMDDLFVPSWWTLAPDVTGNAFASMPTAAKDPSLYPQSSVANVLFPDSTLKPAGFTRSFKNLGGTGARLLSAGSFSAEAKSLPETGAFSIEAWFINQQTGNNDGVIFGQIGSPSSYRWRLRYITNTESYVFEYASTSDPASAKIQLFLTNGGFPADAWCHFALTRDEVNTLRLFVNGFLIGTQADLILVENAPVQNLMVGTGTAGHGASCAVAAFRYSRTRCFYTSNFTPPDENTWARGKADGDPFWAHTVLLLRAESNSAAQAHGSYAVFNSALSGVGTTTTAKHGSYALTNTSTFSASRFEMRGGNAPVSPGGGSATIEFWFRYATMPANALRGGFGQWAPTGNLRSFWCGLNITGGQMFPRCMASNAGTAVTDGVDCRVLQGASALAANTWYHLAACYDADTEMLRLFQDGVMIGKAPLSGGLFVSTAYLGAAVYNTQDAINGAIYDDMRYTKAARYTSDEGFTPPGPLPAYAYVP